MLNSCFVAGDGAFVVDDLDGSIVFGDVLCIVFAMVMIAVVTVVVVVVVVVVLLLLFRCCCCHWLHGLYSLHEHLSRTWKSTAS